MSLAIFLHYERFHFDPPDRQYGINVPLVIVALTLGIGGTAIVTMTASVLWSFIHG